MLRVRFHFSEGDVVVRLFDREAPRTTRHFLEYVEEGYYNNASIYRTVREDNQPGEPVKLSIVEGGYYNEYYADMLRAGFAGRGSYDQALGPHGTHSCIRVETTGETGILHKDGVLSMGRCAPDQVDDSFFFCIGDQPDLDEGGRRSGDGLGFSAFGIVEEGMELLRDIQGRAAEGQLLENPARILSVTMERD